LLSIYTVDYAQYQTTETGVQETVGTYKDANGTTQYALPSTYSIGRLDGSVNPSYPNSSPDIYRSVWTFNPRTDLAIPLDAKITDVSVVVTIYNYESGQGEDVGRIVTLAANTNPADWPNTWASIGNGTSYVDQLKYNNTNGAVVGSVENVTLSSSNLHSLSIPSYLLNTNGIGNRTVKLRITVSTNLAYAHSRLAESIHAPVAGASGAAISLNTLSLATVDIPSTYALDQNYPNPFNPTTTIKYQLPEDGNVSLKIYDELGREVALLADGLKEAGYYSVMIDGSRLSSGVYFARFTVRPQDGKAPFVQTRKLMLLKQPAAVQFSREPRKGHEMMTL
jgi:hypothetical protein